MSGKPVPFDSLPHVLLPCEMQAADAETISAIGIGGFTLMEVAGRAVADCVIARISSEKPWHVTCFCGTGNNGGDGFVASRILLERGILVNLILAGDEARIKGDARAHFDVLKRVAEDHDTLNITTMNSIVAGTAAFSLEESDVVIDALIGTGLENDVRAEIATGINAINNTERPTLSIDIPSGLSGANGQVLGCAVRASETIVMGALKRGLLIGDGPTCTGNLLVAEIGISNAVIRRAASPACSVRQMTPAYNQTRRIERTVKSNKYTSGPTFVVAGSPEFTGAPALASLAAARSGSGYVQCLCPPEIQGILAEKLTDIPVTPWTMAPGTEPGTDADATPDAARDAAPDAQATVSSIGNRFQKGRAFLIGPGLGRSPQTADFVLSLLKQISQTPHNRAVIDADGLFALSGYQDLIRSRSQGQWILTPHRGEVRFLIGKKSMAATTDLDSVELAHKLAEEWNCVILLKGFPSVTASPGGQVIINDSALAAAATAGTGDVLAGMVAGLCAQGLDAFDAAACGVHRASQLAEKYASLHSAESMIASDLLTLLLEFK